MNGKELVGKRIECVHMEDPYNPVPTGTKGTVYHVDSMGQIHVHWDNGQGLALVPECDSYKILD